VALVTGASSGLGARFAEVLAGAGAQVFACARRLDRLQELAARHASIRPVRCDVTDGDDRARAVAEALSHNGSIDICVNNAGTSAPGPAESLSPAEFGRVMRVNVEALFGMTQAAVPSMLEAARGSVINVSSMFGRVASAPVPEAGYVASKSAVDGLTRELAAQWAPRGVRVNAIAPGWFDTDINHDYLNSDEGKKLMRQIPAGRFGADGDLDGALLLLASDAGRYIAGETVVVDGGAVVALPG
jgi:hypothetical protein